MLERPGHIELLRLVVELLARAALGPVRARLAAAALAGGCAARRSAGPGARFTGPCPLLLDRAGRDLSCARRRRAPLARALLDVLVLTASLRAPDSWSRSLRSPLLHAPGGPGRAKPAPRRGMAAPVGCASRRRREPRARPRRDPCPLAARDRRGDGPPLPSSIR